MTRTTKQPDIVRNLALLLAILALMGLGGCLPELEDPPLTATGEAPEDWKFTASGPGTTATTTGGTTTGTSTCSGEFTGTLQDPAIDLSPPPCIVKGNIVFTAQPSAKLKALIGQVITVQGTVQLHGDVALESVLPKLQSVGVLQVQGGGQGKKFILPKTLQSIVKLVVADTAFTGVDDLSSVQTISNVEISQNTKLISIRLLPNAKEISSINVSVNPMLNNMTLGIFATQISNIDLHDNSALTGVEPWVNLKTVTGTVQVSNCPMLDTIHFLPALQSVGSLVLTKVGGKLIELPELQQAGNWTLDAASNFTNLGTLAPGVQITQSVRVCTPTVACATRTAWLTKHAPGLTALPCSSSEPCKP